MPTYFRLIIVTYSNLTGMLKKCSHLNAKHRLQPIENYICRLVCTITCAHTPVHMNSFPSRMQRTLQLKNVFPPTQTHNYCLFFPLHNIYAKHMHLCTSGQAQWHSFPSIPSPCTPPPFLICLFPCRTPARPTARSHTSITCTHICTKSERGSAIVREDKKGGGESRFHATLSNG